MTDASRTWPLAVRVARAEDRDAVMAFATTTWDGWDYMPHAWDRWLDAEDGVMLVGTVAGDDAIDADGTTLERETVVAVVRVAMPAAGEAWLEGIRVDPRARGMDIATDLQVAELRWAHANGAKITRYATSSQNIGSHRLGARGGFEQLVALRGISWDPVKNGPQPDHGRSAFQPDVQAAARRRRHALLDAFAAHGLLATEDDAYRLWQLVSADRAFNAMHRLYEPRPWALEELTQQKFTDHVRLGEVAHLHGTSGDGEGREAVLILVGDVAPAEDEQMRLAVIAGAPRAAFDLVERARELSGAALRFRIPDEPAFDADVRQLYVDAGYEFPEFALHIMARPIDATHPLVDMDPAAVILEDEPRAVIKPPR